MKYWNMKILCFIASLVFAGWDWSDAALAQRKPEKIPDFTQGDEIPAGMQHDWNLGPIGARGSNVWPNK